MKALTEAPASTPVSLRSGVGQAKSLRERLTELPPMPRSGPLVDPYGRVHTDLRLSITDRCNFRCTYCMPEDEAMTFAPSADLLTVDEIARVAAVAHRLGVTAVRLTGGEPLVRRGVVDIVATLGRVGFADLSMTTNGTGLARLAAPLAAAGLQRVNVSCDSLRPATFAAIRRRGHLATVLAAMDAAEAAGLSPLKVNVVLVPGVNDDEIIDFARFARTTGRIVRFIEFMPLDADQRWRRDLVIAGAAVLAGIDAVYPLRALAFDEDDPAPANRYQFADGVGEIGLISSVTDAFCGTCNRLRLTPDGAIRNCLFSDEELSVRDVLRAGGSDADLETLLREAVWGKLPGHGINDPGFLRPTRSMSRLAASTPTLRLFGPIREAAGIGTVDLDGTTVAAVVAAAVQRFGGSFALLSPHCQVWVNGQPAAPEQPVTPADEIALLPPVSGG